MYGGIKKKRKDDPRAQYQELAMQMMANFPFPPAQIPGGPPPPPPPIIPAPISNQTNSSALPPPAPSSSSSIPKNPLIKWSDDTPSEPPIPSQIKAIHIYDFDNTLFKTPHPNPDLLSTGAIGVLESLSGLQHGGWWADSRFLQGTGKGFKEEREVAWKGWWNEDVVELAKLSIEDPGTLTILLSGRRSNQFKTLITQMVESKGLIFDAIVLRQDSINKDYSTLQFKTKVVTDVLNFYADATSISMYEDRPKQANGFRKLLKRLAENRNNNLLYEVIEVYEPQKYLDPLVERQLIQAVVNSHNEALAKRQLSKSCRYGRVDLFKDVLYCGYLLDKQSTVKALNLLEDMSPKPGTNNAYKYEGNAIVVARTSLKNANFTQQLKDSQVKWKITHVGQVPNRIWAAKVQPVDATISVTSEHNTPLIVLVTKRKVNPTEVETIDNWQPLGDDQQVEINTSVGECSVLKLNARKR